MTRFGMHRAEQDPRQLPSAARRRPSIHARRQRFVGIVFTALAGVYAVRLGHLQIVQADELRERLLDQSARAEEIPAPRGAILDRSGQPLATHDARYTAYLAVGELEVDRGAAIGAIDEFLGLAADRERALREATRGWTRFAAGLTDEERAELESRLSTGIHFTTHPARAHPSGTVARRLVGSIDGEGMPRGGLELFFDGLLRGEAGRAELRLDGRGAAYRAPGGEYIAPRPGHDVYLTIDAELQRIAETELARAMTTTGSSAGDIVILDPRTGELLAVASERTGAATGHVPAFSDPYEPGSTLKPFLLASLLNEGLVDLDESLDVEDGVWRAGARTIRDVHGYDRLTVREVITQSSNVGAAKLAGRLRPIVQHRYLRDFGFGMRTRIEHPDESGGHLARPDDWSSLSPASLGMGYEIAATSLQLAAAYGALANGGVLMRPRLIREIRDAGGRVIQSFEPREVRRVVSREVAVQVAGVLEDVVREGTGSMARMASLSVAGKTGTARLAADGGYADGRYRASFIGFAPADDPRVVILTRLEDPAHGSYYGGAIAAPTSQATLAAALAADGTHIDPRRVVSAGNPRRWSGRSPDGPSTGTFVFAVGAAEEPWAPLADGDVDRVEVPNLTGLALRSAAARLHELGLRVEWWGMETVRTQSPAPGAEIAPGQTVVLR